MDVSRLPLRSRCRTYRRQETVDVSIEGERPSSSRLVKEEKERLRLRRFGMAHRLPFSPNRTAVLPRSREARLARPSNAPLEMDSPSLATVRIWGKTRGETLNNGGGVK